MKRKKAAGSAETSLRDEAVALTQRLLDNPTLREAVDTLLSESASAPPAGAPKKRRCACKGRAKLVLLLPIAGIGALAASAPLRSKVLDALFGAEEEFEYSPPADGAV
jgi:hypothetical protein